jgi:L-amino acid N-acyltransferase YncA
MIRKANLSDIKDIEKIYLEGTLDEIRLQFHDLFDDEDTKKEINLEIKWLKQDFKKSLKSGLGYWIVAEDNNIIIGFGELEIDKNINSKATLEKVYVKKEYRKKGIGKDLALELLRYAKDKNIKRVISKIFYNNLPSRNLHEKLGFSIIAIGMEKKL